jgi:hypothetical protein
MTRRNFRWDRPPSQAWDGRLYMRTLFNAVVSLMWYWAPIIEADGKRNARWTDRTGNARQTLAAFVYEPQPWVAALVFRQWMSYGKWLELAHGGRYAIILQTLEQYYAQVWSSVRDVVE